MIDSKLEVTNLITPFINSYKTLSNEWKHLFDIGISDYLHSQTEKYYFTNTFIHRSERVRFNDIYYPITARYKELKTDFFNLSEIFENYKNITLIGSAGSGKTTLVKHIFLNTIKTSKKVPLLIELRFLNDYNGDFEKLITEKILKSKIKPSDETFRRALETGMFLFLLDGYDEIFSNKKQQLNRQIELFVDSYSKNNFIITTRPGSGIENFPRFYDFQVNKLDDNDVTKFITKIVSSNERKDRILSIISNPKNKNYTEYLRNPLLLSMFIIAFESHPEIPTRKSSFYRNVFDTLYSKHDGITKNSFPREKLTKLEREDFEDILSKLSYLTTLDGKYTFTNEYLTDMLQKVMKGTNSKCAIEDLIYDLQTTISILVLDGFEYYFPHRSMQEYFTALLISKLNGEHKSKAYKNLGETLIKSSNDESHNLWSICDELDPSAFKENFTIPELKKFLFDLSILDGKELYDHYWLVIDPTFGFLVTDNKSDNDSMRIVFLRNHNLFTSLVRYYSIYDLHEFYKFAKSKKLQQKYREFRQQSKKSRQNGQINNLIKDAIFEDRPTFYIRLIKKYMKLIEKKVKILEKEISQDKNTMDELLSL